MDGLGDFAIPLEDRVVGALLGIACGDALGAPAEFLSKSEVAERWGTLREMVGGGPWAPGEWTDDTAMTLHVAKGILHDPRDPVPEAGRQFLAWAPTSKDVGVTVRAAIAGFRGDWAEASRGTPQAARGMAAGNGSLMRTLPVALAYPDSERMLQSSARLSAMTHWDPQAEACCAVYCLWVRGLLRDSEPRKAWDAAVLEGKAAAARAEAQEDTPGLSGLPQGFWPRLERAPDLSYDDLQPSGYAGYVVECLEAAVACVLQARSFEDALVQVVNLGGESDTIGAVAGGAAGARWGRKAIPERWLSRLRERDALEQLARDLLGLRRSLLA